LKSEAPIQHDRFPHGSNRIQPHGSISHLPGGLYTGPGQSPSDLEASGVRLHIQAFHLTDIVFKRPYAHASNRLSIDFCQKKCTARRPISSGESIQFLIEILKIKIKIQSIGVFLKQETDCLKVLLTIRLKYTKIFRQPGFRIRSHAFIIIRVPKVPTPCDRGREPCMESGAPQTVLSKSTQRERLPKALDQV